MIPSLVYAQTSTQADLVLELQRMRAEIAELRDLVERQQYQLQQVQQGVDRLNQRDQVRAADSTKVGTNLTSLPSSSGLQNVRTTSSSAEFVRPGLDENNAVIDQTISGTEGTEGEAQTVAPQPDQNFYAVEDNFEEIQPNDRRNPEVASAARQAQGFPPVVERSIGVPQVPIGEGDVVNTQTAELIEDDTDAGVIAVPNTAITNANSSSTSDQNDPSKSSQDEFQSQRNSGSEGLAPVLTEETLYQQGFELLKQFNYSGAIDVFHQQINQYPSGSFADDAHYWIAEAMYLDRNLLESKKYFRIILDEFEQSPRFPDAMLKTAYIEQDQGNEIEARILLQEIIQYHPRSDAAISAKNRLERLN